MLRRLRATLTPYRFMSTGNKIKAIGTHSGTFHCDEALACYMLKLLPEFKAAGLEITTQNLSAPLNLTEGLCFKRPVRVPYEKHRGCEVEGPEGVGRAAGPRGRRGSVI
eukprot:1331619-Amorphochlora_amoeboformis.AAC.2